MKNSIPVFLFACISLASCSSSETKEESKTVTPSPETSVSTSSETGVFFVNLKDGDDVKSPVIIQMGVKGMQVEAAGTMNEGKGHHHLIVDGSFEEKGKMVPKDETHIHFGQGQTVDTLPLTAGKHTLTLQFANGMHESYGEEWSKTISVNVSN